MSLVRRGNALHGPNAFSLRDGSVPILTVNNIGSHPVYRMRVNTSNTYNAQHVAALKNFIVDRLRNYASEDTVRKLGGMVSNIYNARNMAQRGFKSRYNSQFANIQTVLTYLRNQRRELNKAGMNTRAINAHIQQATNRFTANTQNWVRHQDQLKYWRWVRNVVVPEAKRGIRALK